jgi:ATP-dependent Clp protease ATP-binding subunit ClpC
MFERYTEKARRLIFFARYEASDYGSPFIETEHILLRLMREDHARMLRVVSPLDFPRRFRKEIERLIPPRERISTSVEVPVNAD